MRAIRQMLRTFWGGFKIVGTIVLISLSILAAVIGLVLGWVWLALHGHDVAAWGGVVVLILIVFSVICYEVGDYEGKRSRNS